MNENMNQYLEKASVLIEALPYIQRFNRKIIVIKYGGSAMVVKKESHRRCYTFEISWFQTNHRTWWWERNQ